MPENLNPKAEQPEKNENPENGRFESDSQKVVRQHLEDKDHVISEEDIANIRVGMYPPELDEAIAAQSGDEDTIEKMEDRIIGDKSSIPEGDNPKDNRLTPWDTIDPA